MEKNRPEVFSNMGPKHILILFCDQLRADCIGACGNEEIQTPAMDSLVADSTVHDRCITPSPAYNPAFTTSEE